VCANSLWLAYDVIHPKNVQNLLPNHLRLASIPLLESDKPYPNGPKLLFNAYDVESRWMRGHRLEIVTAAYDRLKKSIHLVVLACYTDTMQWDPVGGISRPNARVCRDDSTSSYKVNLLSVDGNEFSVNGCISKRRSLAHRFAVEGNRECYFMTHANPYPMDFDENDVMRPVSKLNKLSISNTLWSDVRKSNPTHAFVHTSPMDFYIFNVRFP